MVKEVVLHTCWCCQRFIRRYWVLFLSDMTAFLAIGFSQVVYDMAGAYSGVRSAWQSSGRD